MVTPTLVTMVIFALLVSALALVISISFKKAETVRVLSYILITVCGVAVLFVGLLYFKQKDEKNSVTALIHQVRPDALLISVDTDINEVRYMPSSQLWPQCVAHYSQRDDNYYFDTESVMCQYTRPKDLPPATTTTTTPPTTVALFPPMSAPPPTNTSVAPPA